MCASSNNGRDGSVQQGNRLQGRTTFKVMGMEATKKLARIKIFDLLRISRAVANLILDKCLEYTECFSYRKTLKVSKLFT